MRPGNLSGHPRLEHLQTLYLLGIEPHWVLPDHAEVGELSGSMLPRNSSSRPAAAAQTVNIRSASSTVTANSGWWWAAAEAAPRKGSSGVTVESDPPAMGIPALSM